MEFKHIPVLFRESIDALDIKPDGLYACLLYTSDAADEG